MLPWLKKKTTPESPGSKKSKQHPFFFYLDCTVGVSGKGAESVLSERDKGTEHRERKQLYEWLAGTCCRVLNKECCFKLLPWAMCLRLGSSW